MQPRPFKCAQILLTRFFQSGLDVNLLFVVLSFKQIFESIYLFDAREVFLTLQILAKEDRQTTGLQIKGCLDRCCSRRRSVANARSRTWWDNFCISFIRVGLWDRLPTPPPLVGSALAVGFSRKHCLSFRKAVGLEKPALPAQTLRLRQVQRPDTFSAEP